MKTRRQARALALQALFEIDSVGHDARAVIQRRCEDENLSAEGVEFTQTLTQGVIANRELLDTIITQYAPEWPVSQLALVDRNILRMALYELEHALDVPIKVAVNEAVELAKIYGSDSAPRFVNGVLGAFLQEHPPGELRK
ncbi:MAG: transcription antitermination factor NusB [Chloroflexi bacterium]|nr:transcription antitermination factor NusB [Chloroflexota bacterium]MBI3742013.1 transcription antitermination factor NusB [Chloroflexota bacterium]